MDEQRLGLWVGVRGVVAGSDLPVSSQANVIGGGADENVKRARLYPEVM
jgi:hypothetical protein